jgi:hypothetical protein
MKRASKCDARGAAGSIEVPSSDDAMRLSTPPRPHSSQQGFSVPPGLRALHFIGLFQAELLKIAQFADCELDTHPNATRPLRVKLVQGGIGIRAGNMRQNGAGGSPPTTGGDPLIKGQ